MKQEKNPNAGAVPSLGRLVAPLGAALDAACDALEQARRQGGELPPGAAAILDDAPLLDAQLRSVRGQLLHDCGVLPAAGDDVRILALARTLQAADGGRIERAALARALAAGVDGAPLGLAELRLFPAALRIALLERLGEIATRGVRTCEERLRAADWAGRMLDTAAQRPSDLVLLVADMARAVQPQGAGFVAELARRLQGQGGTVAQALGWIDARLADDGSSIARQVQAERDTMALDAGLAARILASLRLLDAVDWRALLEEAGSVEPLLRADPEGSYPRMEGATRDLYRSAVERLARRCAASEAAVAQEALALAGRNLTPGEGGLDNRRRHIGYYLVGPGLPMLEARLQPQPPLAERLRRRLRHAPLAAQIAATALLTLLFAACIAVCARRTGAGPLLQALVGLLSLGGASALARSLVDMMTAWLAPPGAGTLPRMDYGAGIPDGQQALVAVSARLDHGGQVAALACELEQRYLANRDPQLRFCLLADLHDAPAETLPGDAALAAQAVQAIEDLNRRHAQNLDVATQDEEGRPASVRRRIEPFVLLLRPRSWSSGEGAWIGRGRRRGQLADLNALLGGTGQPRFATIAGNAAGLTGMRYVIALDAATGLARDAARRLVGAMAHPLNQPVLDAGATRVCEGHALLRPAVGGALAGPLATRYQRLWSEGRGTWAVRMGARECESRGMFGWAAIYDVDAVGRVLRGRLPPDALPEPGLVDEGCLHAASDCEVRLEEAVPASHGDHAARRHRALRAAWQAAGWIGRRPRQAAGALAPNPMTPASRWQLFDLLRDSLVAPTLLVLLVLCWATLADPAFWTAAALAVYFLPALLSSLVALADRPHDAPWRQHLDGWARGARVPLVRAALGASLLPHAAWWQLDALLRSGWRRYVSGRRQLEWRPAALARPARIVRNNWLTMWFAPLVSVATAVLLTFANPYSLFTAAPLLLVWFLSPLLAWWTSLPGAPRALAAVRLPPARQALLARLARRQWAFFEDHAGPAGNWLPPENVQEHPHPLVDARTTPGGIAFYLLAALAARDFGYLSRAALLRRLDASLASIGLLERWNGHFLAAYDHATLAPAEPARVATRDSGWLALALRLLGVGLDELPDAPIAAIQDLDGIRATLHVVDELAQGAAPGQRAQVAAGVAATWAALDPQRCRAADTLPGFAECLRQVTDAAVALQAGLPEDASAALRGWSARLAGQCQAVQDELLALAPWMRAAQEYVLDASLTRIPTLRELAALDAPAGAHHGLVRLVRDGRQHAHKLLNEAARLAAQARGFGAMDFGALVDRDSGVLASGCRVREGHLELDDAGLLASEARIASYLAVATGQLPQRHWWALGRPLRIAAGEQLLLSRSGALADILAPQLLMPAWRDTLLDHAGRAAIRAQIAHGERHGMPWGFTESGCNAVDAQLRYQGGRFGTPAAALERSPDAGLVAAPHASLLALPLAPGPALANLERLAQEGLGCEYGFHDAVDYTPGRLPHGERRHVVRSVAARHQGMGLLALLQALHDGPMQRRFVSDPDLRAAMALLQEPLPACGASESTPRVDTPAQAPVPGRVIDRAGADSADLQLLSNGGYHLLLLSDGAGRSSWGGMPLTRWEPDPLGARGGLAWSLHDTASGETWTPAPHGDLARYEAAFAEGRASYRIEARGLAIVVDVAVAPEDDVELRRIRVRNTGPAPRTLELTGQVALAPPPEADGLPVRVDVPTGALLCFFGAGAPAVFLRMAVRGAAGAPCFSSACADPGGPLPPLEDLARAPALAIRRAIELAPGQELTADLVLGAAATPAGARQLAARHADPLAVDAAIEAAWTHGQAFLRAAGLEDAEAQRYNRLAGCLLQPVAGLRADAGVIERNVRGRAALQGYGVDGSLPLLVLQPGPGSSLAHEVLQAHTYWRARGFEADLLVLCESRAVRDEVAAMAPDDLAGIHLHLLDEVPQEDRILLRAAAHVLLAEERGSLAEQLRRAAPALAALPPPFAPREDAPPWTAAPAPVLEEGSSGAHALANGVFGTVLPASGPGSSWAGRRTRLVSAPEGEAFYLRDEDSGIAWSPTPWPLPSGQPYATRHDFGLTLFTHQAHGIRSELRMFVAVEAPLKYALLRIRNLSDGPRRLSVTGYVQWWLDEADAAPGLQIVSARDVASGALLARNAFGAGFDDRVAFFHLDAPQPAHTADRREFVGPYRSLACPAALERQGLAGTLGAALDPCAALQTVVALEPGTETELVFLLGVAGPDALAASRAVQQHGGAKGAALALRQVHAYWDELLGSLRVSTHDAAFDSAANGWLPYRALAWSMGAPPAVQLQGALAAAHGHPATLRAALLRAAREDIGAAGALVEDFLWLPWALHRYVSVTGDYGILREAAGGEPTSGTRLARDDLYQVCVHGLRGCLRFGARGLPLRAARLHEDAGTQEERGEDLRLGFLLAAVLRRFADVADRRADFGFATTCRGAALALAAQAEEHGWNGAAYAPEGEMPQPATQAWAALAGADPGRVETALSQVDAAPEGRSAAWLALALAGEGAGTRAWELARTLALAHGAASVRYGEAASFIMEGVHDAATAGWTCVLLSDALLGLQRAVDRLALAPLLPEGWEELRFRYRTGRTDHHIVVRRATVGELLVLDGEPRAANAIELEDDGREHQVEVYVERRPGDARAGHGNNQPGTKT